MEVGDLPGFQGTEALLSLLHLPFRDTLPRLQPGREDFHKKMSANCQDKDIEEPQWCHALLLLSTPTTTHLAPDGRGTGPVARLGDTPRIIVVLSWGLPTPALLARQLYPLSRLCGRRLRRIQHALHILQGAQLVGCHHLVSGSPHATRGDAAVV